MSIRYSSGFTLIELIAVMIITGILAVTVSVRFSATDIDLQSAKSDVLAALVFSRQTAMARSDGNTNVVLVLTANTIDVQINSNSASSLSQAYPLTLPTSVSISNGVGSLAFNTLGETNSHTIVLSQGGLSETINVSGVGYAY